MRDHVLGKKTISATSMKKKINRMTVKYKVGNPLGKKKLTAEPAYADVRTLGLHPEVKIVQIFIFEMKEIFNL